MVTCSFDRNNLANISVDAQHLSRLNGVEVREIVLQVLMFGGSELRKEVEHWLAGGTLDKLGYIVGAPQQLPRGEILAGRDPEMAKESKLTSYSTDKQLGPG
jgi:hypothetical protein